MLTQPSPAQFSFVLPGDKKMTTLCFIPGSVCWLLPCAIWCILVPLWAPFSSCVSEDCKLKAVQSPMSSVLLASAGLSETHAWAEHPLGKPSQLGSVHTSAIYDLYRRQLGLHVPPRRLRLSTHRSGKGLTGHRAEPWCWGQKCFAQIQAEDLM